MALSAGGTSIRATIGARLVILLVFALLGPLIGGPVGCSAFLGAIGVVNGGPGTLSAVPGAIGLCVLYGPFFGFAMGFAPAAAAGATLALLGPSRGGRQRAVIISALASAGYAAILFSDRFGDKETANDGALLLAGAILVSGTLAGALCWCVVEALVGGKRQLPDPTPSAPPPPAS